MTGGSLDHRTHGLLLESGHLLTFTPPGLDRFAIDEFSRAVLLTQVCNTGVVRRAGATARGSSLPWVAWNLNDCADTALAAYEAGASAVLPSTFSASAFDGIVHTVVNGGGSTAREPELHSCQPGDRIPLAADTVLWVREGVVALTELHEDGTECLNGFCSSGQVVTGSADPAVRPIAHTAAVVSSQPWSHAVRHP
ncbi:MAG TPA: hypothetical protein VHH34_14215, partial [Pseudonocardiaceae bacterium]|nr:hypothetical protein [Pseudonocardiaceae bacterium]